MRPFLDHVGELMGRIDPYHLMSIHAAYMCDKVSEVKMVSIYYAANRGNTVGESSSDGSFLTGRTLLSLGSDEIIWVSTQDDS